MTMSTQNNNNRFFSVKRTITFFFLLLAGTIQVCLAASDPVHVLLLNSYHTSMDWTDGETAGVGEVIQRDGRPVVLHVKHMDTNRLADDTHFDHLRRLFAYKYRNIHLAAILSTVNE